VTIPERVDSSFWTKERSQELPFVHEDSVRVTTTDGEKIGSVVFIAQYQDAPIYFVELADGSGVNVTASQLTLI
jgi:hypothetical protein